MSRRKRLADLTEKLSVGLFLVGVLAPAAQNRSVDVIVAVALGLAIALAAVSITISYEIKTEEPQGDADG